jgi:N-acetylglucosamine-6-phosphate deacetylase
MCQLSRNILTPEGFFRGALQLRFFGIAGVLVPGVECRSSELLRVLPEFVDLPAHGGGGRDIMDVGCRPRGEPAPCAVRNNVNVGYYYDRPSLMRW